MIIKVLASNSTGNCYILRGVASSLILEAGVSYKEIAAGLGYNLSKVAGCLVTHEHMDHAKAVYHLARKGIDIYASHGTLDALKLGGHRANVLQSKKIAYIGEWNVFPFDVQHDASEPMGFLIQNNITLEKIVFITDSYYCKYRFSGVSCYMVEANYSEAILRVNIEVGRILPTMADRTRRSHFEINRVVEFLKASDLTRAKKVLLMHLSSGNSNATEFTQQVNQETGIECLEAVPGLEIRI